MGLLGAIEAGGTKFVVAVADENYNIVERTAFPTLDGEKIITLSLLLDHKSGVLSRVLNTIAGERGSVLTINQGIPLQGVANASISIETADLKIDLEALMDKLRMVDGVKRIEILGQV